MKKYVSPEMEIVSLSLKDVILTSIINGDESKVESGIIIDPPLDPEMIED